MSKNRLIRRLAEDLPERPKLDSKGNVQRDMVTGKPVLDNHFKTITRIAREEGIQAAGNYVEGLKMGEEAHLRRQKRKETWIAIILILAVMAVALMVSWLKKHENHTGKVRTSQVNTGYQLNSHCWNT